MSLRAYGLIVIISIYKGIGTTTGQNLFKEQHDKFRHAKKETFKTGCCEAAGRALAKNPSHSLPRLHLFSSQ